jgi:rfaE bifunctional protein kinase chain/domain
MEILERIHAVRAGVVGDFYLDAYWYADMTRARLSRETPLFPRPVVQESYNPGGASNVAWNLASLEIKRVAAFTVLGSDWRGEQLLRLLNNARVDNNAVLQRADWSTPLFGKIILRANDLEQEDNRLDFVNTEPLKLTTMQRLFELIEGALPDLDVLVVADYQDEGVLTSQARDRLNALAKQYPAKVFIADSRDHLTSYTSMTLKPNELEAARIFYPKRSPITITEADEISAGVKQSSITGRPIVITRGAQGCLVIDEGQAHNLPSLPIPAPIDPVGAGDTFLAGLAACMGAGLRAVEAAQVAILAACITIQKIRTTGAASPAEILKLYDTWVDPFQ